MTLDAELALIVDGRGTCARRNSDADETGHRERAQELRLRRQIAEALAEEERWRDRAEGFGAHALGTAASDVQVDARRQQRLVRIAMVELVFNAGGEIVEPALGLAFIRAQPFVGCAETDTEILRHSF